MTRDFLHDVSPLVRESILDFMNKLDEFDKKGYFQFAKEIQKAGDNVVTSFTLNDVKLLGIEHSNNIKYHKKSNSTRYAAGN